MSEPIAAIARNRPQSPSSEKVRSVFSVVWFHRLWKLLYGLSESQGPVAETLRIHEVKALGRKRLEQFLQIASAADLPIHLVEVEHLAVAFRFKCWLLPSARKMGSVGKYGDNVKRVCRTHVAWGRLPDVLFDLVLKEFAGIFSAFQAGNVDNNFAGNRVSLP